ncbi:ubiquinone/menaquinone biosynthesis C-methylase UbiE [Pedobacter cryoconitis]|uniref:class I SAM-dependent methyltransferase n=1 Tax=Pedobacter cryoconitis TaxID=188932 RepID=UPI00161EDB9F|nr:class I SAM-dependent methyltransferase [Pedobacter cryoconitis]MBB6270623.1 ubiquinone/menaquinone biosynthesis C-methylase UbiE [Pedobacter cryoconitis]
MNTETKTTAFSGSIPQNYDEYLGPLLFEAYAIDMARRVGLLQPANVLEVACGTGRVTKQLLETLSLKASLVATDINPAMLALAMDKIGKNERVEWKVADAVALPFNNETFDCIAAQFGVMFYSDRVKAYQEAFRVLENGGTFIFNAWDKMSNNPAIMMVHELMEEYFPVNPPSFYNIPFSYFDPAVIKADLTKGGFSDINTTVLKVYGYSANSYDAAKGLLEGTPIHAAIVTHDAELLPELTETLSCRLAELYGASNLSVPLQAVVATAVKK